MPPPRLPLAPSLAHSTVSDFSDGFVALGSTERLSVRQKATDKSRSSRSIDRLLTPSQKLVFEAMHHTIFKHLMFVDPFMNTAENSTEVFKAFIGDWGKEAAKISVKLQSKSRQPLLPFVAPFDDKARIAVCYPLSPPFQSSLSPAKQ